MDFSGSCCILYLISKLPSMSVAYSWCFHYLVQRTMPGVLDGSFEFFKFLPSNPLALPTILQQSLLSLLLELIGWSPKCKIAVRIPPMMYKHLQPFINLLLYSPIRDIRIKRIFWHRLPCQVLVPLTKT